MVESNWMRHSLRLGLVEFKRRLRNVRRNRTRSLLLGTTIAVFAAMFVFITVVLFLYWKRSFSVITIPPTVRPAVTLAWIVSIWYFSQRVLLFHRRLHNESFVLTTVSIRTAVGSLLVADFLFACLALVVPVSFVALGLLYAYFRWVSLVVLSVAIVLFAACTTVLGYVAGFGYLRFSMRSSSVKRTRFGMVTRIILRVAVLVVVLAVFTNGVVPRIEVANVGGFAWLPTSWFIDLGVLGTPVAGSVGRAVGIVFGTAVVVVVGSAVVERLATAYWYGTSDGATTPGTTGLDTNNAMTSETDALTAAISPLFVPRVVNTPTRRVAQVVLLRLRRAPRRLSFLAGPAVSFVVVLSVRTPTPLRLFPVLCVIAVPWLAGAAFGLNPLGDAGAVLPTLLASVSGREFVRGLTVPGVMYGLPLTVACTLVAGALGSYSPVELAGLAAVGAVVTVVSVVAAPAIGMRFPRFDAVIVGQRGGAVLPSLTALAIYSALVGILGRAATAALLEPNGIDGLVASAELPIGVLRLGGTVSVLVIAILVGFVSYRSVISQFATYTLD